MSPCKGNDFQVGSEIQVKGTIFSGTEQFRTQVYATMMYHISSIWRQACPSQLHFNVKGGRVALMVLEGEGEGKRKGEREGEGTNNPRNGER